MDAYTLAGGKRLPSSSVPNVRFRMLRYFSIMSFLSIVIAALLLILFYREVAIKNIIDLGERSNLILGQTALSTMKPLLVDYFASVSDISGEKIRTHPISSELHQAIQGIMQE